MRFRFLHLLAAASVAVVFGVQPAFAKTIEYVYDGNGNVTELLDGETGEIVASYEYSPFGKITRIEGAAAEANKIRFSTKPYDEMSGFYYYGFRYYDPASGRWLNRDPIEEKGGLNLYGFVGNQALSETDSLGLCKRRKCKATGHEVSHHNPTERPKTKGIANAISVGEVLEPVGGLQQGAGSAIATGGQAAINATSGSVGQAAHEVARTNTDLREKFKQNNLGSFVWITVSYEECCKGDNTWVPRTMSGIKCEFKMPRRRIFGPKTDISDADVEGCKKDAEQKICSSEN